MGFFYIPIYGEYWALPCHNLKANIKEEKTIFRMAKSVTRSNIFNSKKNMGCLKLISTDILVSFLRPFSCKKPVYALFTVLVVKKWFQQ